MMAADLPRILMLAHNLAGRGTCIRFEQLALHLSRMGFSVTLLAGTATAHGKVSTDRRGTLKTILVPEPLGGRLGNSGFGPRGILFRIAYALRNEFDIIHASEHRPAAALPALLARRFRSARFIGDWADWWGWNGIVQIRPWPIRWIMALPDSILEKEVHRIADAQTVISRVLQERAASLGLEPDAVLRVPNGADIEGIRPQPMAAARRQLGLPEDGKILVYAGQAPIDMDLLWDTFAYIDRAKKGEVYLLVLGKKWRLPETLGASQGRILQPGCVSRDVYPSYLACGDLMLLPLRRKSLNEARWPGKFGDYLAAGRPIVSNPTGEVGRIMKSKPVGLLAGESPEEFGGAALALLSDPAAGEKMGARARQLAEDELSWASVVRPLPDFYRRVCRFRLPMERMC